MQETVVAIDLETTGFDPRRDRIIEVGAVRFQGDHVVGEWHSMISPGIDIPPFITRLTGIQPSEVKHAPEFGEVRNDFRDFVANDLILGHNLAFDLGFLAANGLSLRNVRMDTYSIASAVLPTAARYNLAALASYLGVPLEDSHRALNDAKVTAAVFHELWKLAVKLPKDIIVEIVRSAMQANWDGYPFFKAVHDVHDTETSHSANAVAGDDSAEIFDRVDNKTKSESISPKRDVEKLDLQSAANLIAPGGALSKAIPGYEFRPQQTQMMELVGDALNHGQHVMIEAPTGVGKSLAYLIPAIQFATANNDRVIVSTNTLPLQEQLIEKDVPLLHSIIETPFRASVLKGRSNYLCPRKFGALRDRGAASSEEALMLARILIWSIDNPSGDKADLALRGPVEEAIWRRLSADDDACKTERCLAEMEGICPFYKAKFAAERAHVLIVNHALLLSDMAAEGRVLPDYRYLIIDEAHHLEDATTDGLSFRTSMEALQRQISELGSESSGLLGTMLRNVRGSVPDAYVQTLLAFVKIVVQANSYMRQHVEFFFTSLLQFLKQRTQSQSSDYTQFIRITSSIRTQSGWQDVETSWGNLSQFTSSIADAMAKLDGGLRELADFEIDNFEDLEADVGMASRHLGEIHTQLNSFVTAPDPNTVYWAEFQSGAERLSVHSAPLDVGPLIKRFIWDAKDTVVMTSATLRTGDTFGFLRERLDADHVQEFVVDSPFDYESSTLLFVVDDIDEPSQGASYQSALQQGVLDLCIATHGRALILFTSLAQLRETASFLETPLAAKDIALYDQASGSSRSQLLQGFVESEKAVLLGTRSFWEGVDLPGSDLSVLAIARLPFSVPTDPMFAARSEQFEDPFMQYSVPETILRFRQGFGRLIRRKSDRGVVAIFDKRIISKRYGELFLKSLPRCTLRRGTAADLVRAAPRWLESE